MLNDNITISPINRWTSLLSWTAANAEDVSWIFLGGQMVYSPLQSEEIFRTAIVPLGGGDIKALEIHDLPEGIIPDAIAVTTGQGPM